MGIIRKTDGSGMCVVAANTGIQRSHFFRIFEIIIFCFGVAICDLVHDMEAIFHLP